MSEVSMNRIRVITRAYDTPKLLFAEPFMGRTTRMLRDTVKWEITRDARWSVEVPVLTSCRNDEVTELHQS